MDLEHKNVYSEAQDKWGIDSQIYVAIEEFGELITALAKRNRFYNGSSHEDIIEEIADAYVMLDQLSIIFGEIEVESKYEEKFNRLKNWLDSDKKVW